MFSHLFAMKWWGLDATILVFWILLFKPTFSLSSLTFIKRLFSSSLLSSDYLMLLISVPVILIPACASSGLAFHMMYSAYKLNKWADIQPWCTPFPIWNQSVVPCPALIVASWPAYRISPKAAKVVWYFPLFKNFPQFVVMHTVKGFGIVNKAEVNVFLELSCFFYDPTDVGNLMFRSSAFSKSRLNIW